MQTHKYKHQQKIVRHVSISFKDLLCIPAKASNTLGNILNAPENLKISPNCQSDEKILNFSLYRSFKENKASKKDINYDNFRRQRLKILSSGYKLRRESLSFIF